MAGERLTRDDWVRAGLKALARDRDARHPSMRDLLDESQQPRVVLDHVETHSGVRRPRVFVSARSGQGLAALRELIARLADDDSASSTLNLPAAAPVDANVAQAAVTHSSATP